MSFVSLHITHKHIVLQADSEDVYSGDTGVYHPDIKDNSYASRPLDNDLTKTMKNNEKETGVELPQLTRDNHHNDKNSNLLSDTNTDTTGIALETPSQRYLDGLGFMLSYTNDEHCTAVNNMASKKQIVDNVVADRVRQHDDRIATSLCTSDTQSEIQKTETCKLQLASNRKLTDTAVTCHILTVPSLDESCQTDQLTRVTSPNEAQHGFNRQVSSVSTQTEQFISTTSPTRFVIYQHDSTRPGENSPVIKINSSKTITKPIHSDSATESRTKVY